LQAKISGIFLMEITRTGIPMPMIIAL
jgi:hypothetical protein